MFDIKDFYLSISKELLTETTLAETTINLDYHDKKIIYHSRKLLLFSQEQTWMKKGIFLLNFLGRQYDTKNIGLCRDDGLSIFKNCSGPQMEKIKKQLPKVFKNKSLTMVWT